MIKDINKEITNRINSIEGHIKALKTMVENERACEEVLIQVSAIESAINKVGKMILKNHLNTCVKESIREGKNDILDRFNSILDKYI